MLRKKGWIGSVRKVITFNASLSAIYNFLDQTCPDEAESAPGLGMFVPAEA